jgi:hypothetical protein
VSLSREGEWKGVSRLSLNDSQNEAGANEKRTYETQQTTESSRNQPSPSPLARKLAEMDPLELENGQPHAEQDMARRSRWPAVCGSVDGVGKTGGVEVEHEGVTDEVEAGPDHRSVEREADEGRQA